MRKILFGMLNCLQLNFCLGKCSTQTCNDNLQRHFTLFLSKRNNLQISRCFFSISPSLYLFLIVPNRWEWMKSKIYARKVHGERGEKNVIQHENFLKCIIRASINSVNIFYERLQANKFDHGKIFRKL